LGTWIRFALALPLVGAPSLHAHPKALPTVVLQRTAVPGTDRQSGLGLAFFPPHAVKPRHAATGPELIYVLAGRLTVTISGRAPVVLRANESYTIPACAIHESAAGPEGAKVLAFWVRTPGTPFNVPIPKGSARRAGVSRCTSPRAMHPSGTARQFAPEI
jgi:quercetin dioxygenase-like cupin family protein